MNIPNDILCLIANYCNGVDLVYFIRCYPGKISLKNYLEKRIRNEYFGREMVKVLPKNLVSFFFIAARGNIPNTIIYAFLTFCEEKLFFTENVLVGSYFIGALISGSSFFGSKIILALIKFFFRDMMLYDELLRSYLRIRIHYPDLDLLSIAFDCMENKMCNLDSVIKILNHIHCISTDKDKKKLLCEKVLKLCIKNDMAVDLITTLSNPNNFRTSLNSFNICS